MTEFEPGTRVRLLAIPVTGRIERALTGPNENWYRVTSLRYHGDNDVARMIVRRSEHWWLHEDEIEPK